MDNTILKMASKRSEVDGCLQLPGVAAVFTQDVGDYKTPDVQLKEVKSEQVPAKEKPKARVGDPPLRTPPKPAAEEPKPEEEAPEISGPPGSLDEIEYRLRGHISDFDGTIKLGERPDSYRVYKVRHLGDDEFRMITDWIAQLGGLWSKEENCWKIPKGAKG